VTLSSGRRLSIARRTALRPIAMHAIAVASLALAGCPRSNPPFLHDGGGIDAAPYVDTDEDGLCDPHELSRGTSLDDPDTDADGFSDLVEASLGFDPLLPASPERDLLVFLREQPGATAHVTLALPVSGMGETFTGTFTSARQVFEDGQSATLFFDSAEAIGAEPLTNVFSIEGESVLGVNGRTHAVKRDDGRIVAIRRLTLVIDPTDPDAPWCGARPCW